MKIHFTHVICLLVFCSCFGLGCSSSASSAGKGYYQNISVKTDPPGATVALGSQTKKSPATFELKRSAVNQTVLISKPGYMPVKRTLKAESTFSGTLFSDANDYMSGKALVYKPSSIDVDLTKVEDAKYKHVQVWVKGVGAVPNVVSPNSEFGFYAKYIISDNTTLDVTIPIELGFAIIQGNKTLYSDSTRLKVPKDKDYITEKNGLRAGRIPGRYSLQVWIKYKDKVSRLTTKLDVR